MANTTYGSGTAMQFSSGEQRQVLELGDKIHYYNPDVTPIFSLFGMSSNPTPVPIFEWMEDEYMIKKSVVVDVDSSGTEIKDATGSAVNNKGSIIRLNRQAQMEAFEVGGVYDVSVTGGVTANASMSQVLVIATGEACSIASGDERDIQIISGDGSDSANFVHNQRSAGSALFSQSSSAGTISFTYVGNAGVFSTFAKPGHQVGQTSLADNETAPIETGSQGYAEGSAVANESRKKVRRLKNCTQIFREPYTITNTAKVAEHYGGSELARLQARKLAKIKGDIEWAILTNGALSLDDSSENPKRKFQGIGLGSSDGFIKSNNGEDNANLRLGYGSGTLGQFDALVEYLFSDMVSGSMSKTVFASNKWMIKLVDLLRDADTGFYDSGEESRLGMRVRSYLGPVGELNFVPHPYLKGAYADYAIAIDEANFDVRPLNGRDMQLRSDIVKDGRDGQTDEWLMEVGVEARNEQTHAILKLSA
tara:strand:+ start:7779 stop:9212 length:1434 start_codon:yes stop_codon:yes gene_type:complete